MKFASENGGKNVNTPHEDMFMYYVQTFTLQPCSYSLTTHTHKDIHLVQSCFDFPLVEKTINVHLPSSTNC